jgi:hypothetical protein
MYNRVQSLIVLACLHVDPNNWSSEDVYNYFIHLDDGQYSQYANTLSKYTGEELLHLSEDQFRILIPGRDGILLYDALGSQEQKALEQKKQSSITSGTAISVGIIVGAAIGGISVVAIAIAVVYRVCMTRSRR